TNGHQPTMKKDYKNGTIKQPHQDERTGAEQLTYRCNNDESATAKLRKDKPVQKNERVIIEMIEKRFEQS
ncbi:5845_t:CDS:2, partial [Dentiscutata erythropus]